MNLGGEEKNPKSWGNGYFRFTLADIIKYGTLLITATAFLLRLETKQDVNIRATNRVEKKVDRAVEYIKTSTVSKSQADVLWNQRNREMGRFDKRVRRIEMKVGIIADPREDERIDLPDWDNRHPIDWLDYQAGGREENGKSE